MYPLPIEPANQPTVFPEIFEENPLLGCTLELSVKDASLLRMYVRSAPDLPPFLKKLADKPKSKLTVVVIAVVNKIQSAKLIALRVVPLEDFRGVVLANWSKEFLRTPAQACDKACQDCSENLLEIDYRQTKVYSYTANLCANLASKRRYYLSHALVHTVLTGGVMLFDEDLPRQHQTEAAAPPQGGPSGQRAKKRRAKGEPGP